MKIKALQHIPLYNFIGEREYVNSGSIQPKITEGSEEHPKLCPDD